MHWYRIELCQTFSALVLDYEMIYFGQTSVVRRQPSDQSTKAPSTDIRAVPKTRSAECGVRSLR